MAGRNRLRTGGGVTMTRMRRTRGDAGAMNEDCGCGSKKRLSLGAWTSGLGAGAILLLAPKCPACFAAYALLWTGVGLSYQMFGVIRILALVVCLGTLATCLYRIARNRG